MEDNEIIKLYDQGHSINYIINKCYKADLRENKVINLHDKRRIIVINNKILKDNVRGRVYRLIYGNCINNINNK